MFVVYLGLTAVAVAVGAFGWMSAHVRPPPAVIRDDLGPISRTFPVAPSTLEHAVVSTAHHLTGAKLTGHGNDGIVIAVRPRLGRLDDAMGLFVRIRVDSTTTGSRYRVTGMCRSLTGLNTTSSRALVGFERDLRLAMKRQTGVVADLVPTVDG